MKNKNKHQYKGERLHKENKGQNHKNKETSRFIEGIITISHKGFGSVRVKGQDDPIEVDHSFLHTACHGDTVKIILHPRRSGLVQTGEVSEILRRSKKGYAGVLEKENDTYFLVPSDLRMYADIVVPEKELNGAKIGQKIFVVITDWKDAKKAPIGRVEKVLGMPMEHNAEMEAIALEKGFSALFPTIVENEAKGIALRGITESDMKNRKDMRNVTTFTIDPIDAKDFDDAISFVKLPNGHFEIGVHIADVSHYVRLNTELDHEAQSRGTSVYLVDRTIPMLPEELSNGLCSLNEAVDRLTFSAIFELEGGEGSKEKRESSALESELRTAKAGSATELAKVEKEITILREKIQDQKAAGLESAAKMTYHDLEKKQKEKAIIRGSDFAGETDNTGAVIAGTGVTKVSGGIAVCGILPQ